MKVRLFTENDLSACTETFVEVFNDEPWNDHWSIEKAKQYLSGFIATPGFKGMIALKGQTVIGFLFGVHRIWWNGDEFFIHEMCVRSEKQNKGIGTMLLKFLENELENRNVTHISLLTDRGIPAELFYLKNGFREIERLMFLSKRIQ
ncbi:GNAT family N-acetyltransferase [Pseudobacillus badius]|uniref:GNAT family N-acetyltransferase n=1 Tax=Bacillus badius TaxID=1455 RepID=UPI00059765AA|nr:GNAT family N-acetyltransferase [Bacillus badius]KIL74952.1 hypothetical protein SD78_2021 [Bacillus badius]KZR60107.1 GCN5 family acetyltransferase [Bacillus badius]